MHESYLGNGFNVFKPSIASGDTLLRSDACLYSLSKRSVQGLSCFQDFRVLLASGLLFLTHHGTAAEIPDPAADVTVYTNQICFQLRRQPDSPRLTRADYSSSVIHSCSRVAVLTYSNGSRIMQSTILCQQDNNKAS